MSNIPPIIERPSKIYFANMTLEYFLTSFLGTKDTRGMEPISNLFASAKRDDFMRRIAPEETPDRGHANNIFFDLATKLYQRAFPMEIAEVQTRLKTIFTSTALNRPHFYELRFDLFALYIMQARGELHGSMPFASTPVYSKSLVKNNQGIPEIRTSEQYVFPYRRVDDVKSKGMATVSLMGEGAQNLLLTMQGVLVTTRQSLRDINASGQAQMEFTYERMACTIKQDEISIIGDKLTKVAYALIKGEKHLVFIEQGPLQVNNVILRLYKCAIPKQESGIHNSMMALSIMLSTQYTSILSQHTAQPTGVIEVQEGYGADFPINLTAYPFGLANVMGIIARMQSSKTLIAVLDAIVKLPFERAYACIFAIKLFQCMSALTHGLIHRPSINQVGIEQHFKRMYGLYSGRLLATPHNIKQYSPMEAILLNEAGRAIVHTISGLLNPNLPTSSIADPIVSLGLQLFSTFPRLQEDRVA